MATWGTLVTRSTGELITASIWNGLLGPSGNLQWIYDGPGARATATAFALAGSGAFTKIQLNTETWDPLGWFDPTTNYRFQPTTAGTYLFASSLYCAAGPTLLQIAFYLNGAFQSGHYDNATAGLDWAISHADSFELNGSSDYIEVFAAQNAGSNRNVNVAFIGRRVGTT